MKRIQAIRRKMMKKNTLLGLVIISMIMLLSTGNSFAREYTHEEVSDGDMLADILVRPVSALGTAFGAAAFTLGLPFSILAGNTDESAEKLVKEPFDYTFRREWGYYPSDETK